MRNEWKKLEILSYSLEKPEDGVYHSGRSYKAEVILNINGLAPENIGIDFIITRVLHDGSHEFIASTELELVSTKESKSLYRLEMTPEKSGTFSYGLRLYPKHNDIPYRQDFYLIKWIN